MILLDFNGWACHLESRLLVQLQTWGALPLSYSASMCVISCPTSVWRFQRGKIKPKVLYQKSSSLLSYFSVACELVMEVLGLATSQTRPSQCLWVLAIITRHKSQEVSTKSVTHVAETQL